MQTDEMYYFLKRAGEESILARNSDNPLAAKVHFQLANLYRARAAERMPQMRWKAGHNRFSGSPGHRQAGWQRLLKDDGIFRS